MLANARSLTDKMGELELIGAREQYDIIGITETWWDETHDWTVNLEDYSLFRKDRTNRRGGGVCLYVKPDLKPFIRDDVNEGNDENVETLWIEISSGGKSIKKMFVGICYKPPNIWEIEEAKILLQMENASKLGHVCIMGDLDWGNEISITTKVNRFLGVLKDNYMTEIIEEPTRRGAILDLVISNNVEVITNT
ncbi:hypothetical protein FKM82_030646 [Ascaphus truei]